MWMSWYSLHCNCTTVTPYKHQLGVVGWLSGLWCGSKHSTCITDRIVPRFHGHAVHMPSSQRHSTGLTTSTMTALFGSVYTWEAMCVLVFQMCEFVCMTPHLHISSVPEYFQRELLHRNATWLTRFPYAIYCAPRTCTDEMLKQPGIGM